MNADRLLALYDRVADAPDAIDRLRRFVLDLAVRGKLVEQDPADEPASALLKRVAAHKMRLVKAGQIKKLKRLEVVDETSYDLPSGWSFVALGAVVVKHLGGGTPSKSNEKYWGGSVRWASVKDVGKSKYLDDTIDRITEAGLENSSSNLIEPGNLLVVTRMGLGKVSINRVAVAINQDLRALMLSDLMSVDYAYNFFLTHGFKGTGLTVKGIKLKELLSIPFPLPPLAEQRRIVAKVDELMGLCDQLEETRAAREDTRDRLTKASLNCLIASDIDRPTFRSHARFAVNALPALTARADQVNHLRQTILNLAVRGRLVEQDPADEPLPRVDRAIPCDLEPPFQVPPNWRWSRLRTLGTLRGGGTPSKARVDFWNGNIPWVSPKEMKLDYIAGAQMHITEAALAASPVNIIEPESILFVVRGMILAHSFPVAIARVPLTINQDMKAITLEKREMAEYLLRALRALRPEMLARVQRSSHGTCRIAASDYADFMIPLPPAAEQHRIVVKIDELMALCDRMETGLATADGTRTRLLDSLLHDALASAVYQAATTTRPEARNTSPERARGGGVPSRS